MTFDQEIILFLLGAGIAILSGYLGYRYQLQIAEKQMEQQRLLHEKEMKQQRELHENELEEARNLLMIQMESEKDKAEKIKEENLKTYLVGGDAEKRNREITALADGWVPGAPDKKATWNSFGTEEDDLSKKYTKKSFSPIAILILVVIVTLLSWIMSNYGSHLIQ